MRVEKEWRDDYNIPCRLNSDTLTDYLLCHDDQLEGRIVAFIFYLIPDWTPQDGGYYKPNFTQTITCVVFQVIWSSLILTVRLSYCPTAICTIVCLQVVVSVSVDVGEPGRVVVSIHPVWNNFIFFEVTRNSFHQVTTDWEMVHF